MKEAVQIVGLVIAGVCVICTIRMRFRVDAERQKSAEKGLQAWARYQHSLWKRPVYCLFTVMALLCSFLVLYLARAIS